MFGGAPYGALPYSDDGVVAPSSFSVGSGSETGSDATFTVALRASSGHARGNKGKTRAPLRYRPIPETYHFTFKVASGSETTSAATFDVALPRPSVGRFASRSATGSRATFAVALSFGAASAGDTTSAMAGTVTQPWTLEVERAIAQLREEMFVTQHYGELAELLGVE